MAQKINLTKYVLLRFKASREGRNRGLDLITRPDRHRWALRKLSKNLKIRHNRHPLPEKKTSSGGIFLSSTCDYIVRGGRT